jgi:hypothetical protein
MSYRFNTPVPVAAWSKAWSFGGSFGGLVGSNLGGGGGCGGISVSCERCVFSGKGLCDGLITHPEQSCQVLCVFECDRESSKLRMS